MLKCEELLPRLSNTCACKRIKVQVTWY